MSPVLTLLDRSTWTTLESAHAERVDAVTAGQERSLLAVDTPLPTADELGAQFEEFLAEQQGPGRE